MGILHTSEEDVRPSRQAAMIGSTKSWLSVNSIEITAEVSGARVTPARYAAMYLQVADRPTIQFGLTASRQQVKRNFSIVPSRKSTRTPSSEVAYLGQRITEGR